MPQENIDNFPFPALALPPAPLQLRHSDSTKGDFEVFDTLRRKWLVLTPEEWVRQNFVHFLISQLGYPAGLVANEYGIRLNRTLRRCDTVVFDRTLRPAVIVEYKAPSVAITQRVFDQIARYNIVLQSRYLIVSNGLEHYCCRFSGSAYTFRPALPTYSELQ